jgi:hypothetical protein
MTRVAGTAAVCATVALPALAIVVRLCTVFAGPCNAAGGTAWIAGMLGLVAWSAHLARRVVSTTACLCNGHSATNTDGQHRCDQKLCDC